MRSRRVTIRSTALFAVVSLATAMSTGAATTRSLVTITTLAYARGTVTSVAQDSGHVAWITTGDPAGCGTVVRLRTLASHSQVSLNTAGGSACSNEEAGSGPEYDSRSLALYGDRQAMWLWSEFGNDAYFHLVNGSPGHADTQFDQLEWSSASTFGVNTASAGSTAVVAWYWADLRDSCAGGSGPCPTVVYDGGIETAAGVRVPGAPPAILVAGSTGRVASVLAGTVGAPVSDGSSVEIRNVASGALLGHFSATGQIFGIAMASHMVAVLTASRIERHSIAGATLTTIPVHGASDLSVSDRWIVYRVGTTIHAVPQVGTAAIAFSAAHTPIDLSVSGNRIVWAEKTGTDRARIQAVVLPGS